jgi:hypothetical protein
MVAFWFFRLPSLFGPLAAVTLAGGLLSSGIVSAQPAAAPATAAQLAQASTASSLPRLVRNRVVIFAAQELAISRGSLQVVEAREVVWPDGCLGIVNPAELCLAAQVPGWQVQLRDLATSRTYIYRTNRTGSVVRAEPAASGVNALSPLAAEQILQAALATAQLPPDQLKIVAAQPRIWNGCYGLPETSMSACPAIAINGWQIVVTAPDHVWVYHTNVDGSEVRLNSTASQLGGATVVPQLLSEQPPEADGAAGQSALFTVIESGGSGGRRLQTMLMPDGRVLQVELMGTQPYAAETIKQLSPAAVAALTEQLQAVPLEHLQGLAYLAADGSADPVTVTLLPGAALATQYAAGLEPELPAALQQVIRLWNTQLLP